MKIIHETTTQAYILYPAEFAYDRPRIQRTGDMAEWIWRGPKGELGSWEPVGHNHNLPAVVKRKAG